MYDNEESDKSNIREELLYTSIGGLTKDSVPSEALVIPTIDGFGATDS